VPNKAYFDALAQNVIRSQKVKIIPFYKRPITWIGAAAAIVLILMVVKFDSPKELVERDVLSALDDIPRDVILAYVEDNIDDFDIELIAEIIPSSALEIEKKEGKSVNHEKPIESVSFDNITRDEILKYLEDEELDFSDLEDEDSFI
jgi:hypothetical protein